MGFGKFLLWSLASSLIIGLASAVIARIIPR